MSQTEPTGPEGTDVPFEQLNFIMLSRIYDVLMAQLAKDHPETHRDLLAAHMSGLILGTEPWMNGQFVTDEVNSEPEPS